MRYLEAEYMNVIRYQQVTTAGNSNIKLLDIKEYTIFLIFNIY